MAGATRSALRVLRAAPAMVSGRSGWLLGLGVGVFQYPQLATVPTRTRAPRDAGSEVVSGGEAQLRGACTAFRARECRSAALPERAPGPAIAILAGVCGPGAQAGNEASVTG